MNYKETYDYLYANGYTEGPYAALWEWGQVKANRVLDIGCGTCGLAQIVDSSVRLYGVDVSDNAIQRLPDRAKRYSGIKILDLTKQSLGSGPMMDLIFCSDVLEHIHPDDLSRFFDNAISLLAKGGHFLASVCLRPSVWRDHSGGDLHLSIMSHSNWRAWFASRMVIVKEKAFDADLWILGRRHD